MRPAPWTPYGWPPSEAQLCGWDKIGTLEPGKRADIVTVDLSRNTSLYPLNVGTLLTFFAFNGPGTQVSDAMVDGVFLRRNGEFTIFDEEAIIAKANKWCDKFTVDYMTAKATGAPMFNRVHEEYTRI
jgi:hypothetical protein